MPNSLNKSRRHAIIAIATAASVAVPILGESGPAGGGDRKIIAESRFDVTNAPRQAELVQLVVDFPPGAWTSWHTHGGQAINLVLEGEITLRHAGMEHPYRAGQAWTDSSLDRQLQSSSRCRQYRIGQGPPAHEFSIASGRVANDGGAGIPVRADDRVCRELSSAGAACRNADRAAGGRSRSRLTHGRRVGRFHGKPRPCRRGDLQGRTGTQALPGRASLVGGHRHFGWGAERIGRNGPSVHDLFAAERNRPLAQIPLKYCELEL